MRSPDTFRTDTDGSVWKKVSKPKEQPTDYERGVKLGHKWLNSLPNDPNTYECANGCGSRVTIDFYCDAPEAAAIQQNIGKCQSKSKKKKK